MELNPSITDPDLIYVGQVLTITGTAPKVEENTTYRAEITAFGLQSNTDNVLFATWQWDKTETEKYQLRWKFKTEDGTWFYGSNSYVSVDENDPAASKQSTYTIPSNAVVVTFEVKPISKKKTGSANGTDTYHWTASWSTTKTYNVSDSPPKTPPIPSVEIDKYKLTATLNNLNVNATSIEFQVVKNDTTVFKSGTATINTTTNFASYSCTIDAGSEYKVRCRSRRDNQYSNWSDFSGSVGAIPSAPSSITTCRANSSTSVYLEWSAVPSATSYDIEYATKKTYFDGSDQTSTVTGIEFTKYEKTGLQTGEEYFFRVRAVNIKGQSGWSSIASTVLGKKPIAPTTWSSTTTVTVGEPLTLYWVHNAEDGSSQTFAELELTIGGVTETHTIKNSTEEDEKDKTSFYSIDTSEFAEGTTIQWRVRTAGVTKVYGEWSVQRTIDVYAPPTMELKVTNSSGGIINTLTSFPFYISALTGPKTQIPIGYHLTINANEAYETVDSVGNVKMVSAGDQVYSKYFDTTDALLVEMSAGNLDLENNIEYTVACVASMNSGLTVEETVIFTVGWQDIKYEPNAEIGINSDTYSAFIRPHCEDNRGNPIADVTLSVYRREFDGSFVELGRDIDNTANTFITDPHPALDYARYRVVATTKSTGAVSYYDVPGHLVGCKAAIIQWDEKWEQFEASEDNILVEPTWSGSMLKLHYNIDVSDKHQKDAALVEYIGRKRPVSYYGTQLGETSTWNMVIPKSDTETLYMLRRLAIWPGDVYVRHPSGSGYWANVTVSFSQKHKEVTIPVTIDIVRVEGGI